MQCGEAHCDLQPEDKNGSVLITSRVKERIHTIIKLRENYHSISIKIADVATTSITIKIGYDGFGINGACRLAPEIAVPFLQQLGKDVTEAMSKYLGTTTNLCGCKNYGGFAKLMASKLERATSWKDVVTILNDLEAAA